MNFNSELQQIYSLVWDSIKHTNFFDQQKMNFGKFIFLSIISKCLNFFFLIGINHYYMMDFKTFQKFWNASEFFNSQRKNHLGIITIWFQPQIKNALFSKYLIWNFILPQRLSALWVYFSNMQRTFTISKYLFRNVF